MVEQSHIAKKSRRWDYWDFLISILLQNGKQWKTGHLETLKIFRTISQSRKNGEILRMPKKNKRHQDIITDKRFNLRSHVRLMFPAPISETEFSILINTL